MPLGRILKHQQTKWCDRNTQMRWRRRNVAIVIRCKGPAFSLTVEEDADCIEGVETFKYLGRILYQSDDNCSAVLRNVRKVRRVWNRMGGLLCREGA